MARRRQSAGRSEQYELSLLSSRLEVERCWGVLGGMNGSGAKYEAKSQYEHCQEIRTSPEPDS